MADLKIKITLGGRVYPLTVKAEEEVFLRNAGKKLNQMLRGFESDYGMNDRVDALSLMALQTQAQLLKLQEQKTGNDVNTDQRMVALIREIDESL